MRSQSIGRLVKVLGIVSYPLVIVGGGVVIRERTSDVVSYFSLATVTVWMAAMAAGMLGYYYCAKKLTQTVDDSDSESAVEAGKRTPRSRALLIGGRALAVASGAVYCAGMVMTLRDERVVSLYTLGPILLSAGLMLLILVLMLGIIRETMDALDSHSDDIIRSRFFRDWSLK